MNTTHSDGNQLREDADWQFFIQSAWQHIDLCNARPCEECRAIYRRLTTPRGTHTSGEGNQPLSDLRGDPDALRTSGDDTRDPVSASSAKLSGAASALVEQMSVFVVHGSSHDEIITAILSWRDALSALLAQAGQHEKDQKDLSRMDTMGSSTDSRTAPTATAIQPEAPRRPWPDPTPEMLSTACFEAIWQCIRKWDINVPDVYVGYTGATGNHVRAILDAIDSPAGDAVREDVR